MKTIKNYLCATVAALATVAVVPALAQSNFPSNPVTIVVPYVPGGATDLFSRTVAVKMGEKLGQPVIIDNKPGAGTAIAASDVARARPDGYRILMGDGSTFATNASLYKKLSYDPSRDFAPISITARIPLVLLVNSAVYPYKSVDELVAAARKAPNTINYASAGNGNSLHLAAAMFEYAAGVRLVHIPYRGSGAIVPDLLSGQIGMAFLDYTSARAHLASGKLRALAVTSAKPIAGLPTVPTMAASYPGFESSVWFALAAPKATPPATIALLREAYVAAINDPATRQKVEMAGIEPLQTTAAEADAFIREEAVRWGKVIKEAGIEVD